MSSEIFESYKHSGKFGLNALLLAFLAAVAAGFSLGLAYAYLMRWIPFIILRVFGVAGYGLLFGFLIMSLMKACKVRNTKVATLCGFGTGLLALYFAWSGYVYTHFKDAPLICPPDAMLTAIGQLYDKGSWSLSGTKVSGIPLAIVWVVEGIMITGLSALLPFGAISEMPFCETNQCWLDKEKSIDTLEAFSDPEQIAAFKRGDLGPLVQAKPRAQNASAFTRLRLKFSPHSAEFCTVRLENVAFTTDKEGRPVETKTQLTGNLMLPQSMLALITKFENFKSPQESAPQKEVA
jgi:hypothetical protein